MLLSITVGMMMQSFHTHLSNPFSHTYWLAEETIETTTRASLAPLQDMNDKLKAHMSKHHRLGGANADSGHYIHWMRLQTSVYLTTSNFLGRIQERV